MADNFSSSLKFHVSLIFKPEGTDISNQHDRNWS